MQRFMCLHTVPPGVITVDQMCQLMEAGQHDSVIRGYRNFINLSAGKAVCIIEAPDAESIANWFQSMNLPYDSITLVEWEGDRGEVHDVRLVAAGQSHN